MCKVLMCWCVGCESGSGEGSRLVCCGEGEARCVFWVERLCVGRRSGLVLLLLLRRAYAWLLMREPGRGLGRVVCLSL